MNYNEETQFDNNSRRNFDETEMTNNNPSDNATASGKRKSNGLGRAAAMAGAAAAGAGASFLYGFTTKDAGSEQETEADNTIEAGVVDPAWSDGQVAVAHGDYDDMTFSEAFAAARAEVGPGGAFEWHGKVYGTYLKNEWESMTPAQRAEYSSHFSWNHHSSTGSEHHANEEHVSREEHREHTGHNTGKSDDEMPELQVIGVAHDYDSDINIAVVSVDGEKVLLVDVDNDEEFDILAYDINQDGTISSNEMVDIKGENITVSTLGGFTSFPEPEPEMYGGPEVVYDPNLGADIDPQLEYGLGDDSILIDPLP